jgi:hypothetical protein
MYRSHYEVGNVVTLLMQKIALYRFDNTAVSLIYSPNTNYLKDINLRINVLYNNKNAVKEIMKYLAIAISLLNYVDDEMKNLLFIINNAGLFGKYEIRQVDKKYAIYDYSSQNVQNQLV